MDRLPDAAKAAMAGNRAALTTYGGPPMADPGLLDRLAGIAVPVLVVWGEADRMIPAEHGQAYAAAIPGARLLVIPRGRAPAPARGARPSCSRPCRSSRRPRSPDAEGSHPDG